MPTYIYETVTPSPERFELRQAFGEPALTTHPETGAPVRRVISGGLAILPKGANSAETPETGCGPANCGCGRYS